MLKNILALLALLLLASSGEEVKVVAHNEKSCTAEDQSGGISSNFHHMVINEVPGYYIEPSLQNLLLVDLKHETLLEIGENLEIQYLGQSETESPTYPVTGLIFLPNMRLMVNLVCSRQKRDGTNGHLINVIFLINTGSPVTYLSQQAIQALINFPAANTPRSLSIRIHDGTVILCHVSPQDKHFADVNVLGMDYLSSRQLSISLDYKKKTVKLFSSEIVPFHHHEFSS